MSESVAPDPSSGVARKARNEDVELGTAAGGAPRVARVPFDSAQGRGADEGVRPYTSNGGLLPWRRDE
jgi:hypothetical protein